MSQYKEIIFDRNKLNREMMQYMHATYDIPVYLKQYIAQDCIDDLLIAAMRTELCTTLDEITRSSKDYILDYVTDQWPMMTTRELHIITSAVLNSPVHMSACGLAAENIDPDIWNYWDIYVNDDAFIVKCQGDWRIIKFYEDHFADGYYTP